MRTEQEMMDVILETARKNENIRLVLMSGSRACDSATKDIFQDYDIMYVVKEVASLVEDRAWIDVFGKQIIMQTPDEMDGIWPQCQDKFAYLMLFQDGNRIDLTLMDIGKFVETEMESQSLLLLDKDGLVKEMSVSSDRDYLPKQPSEKEFQNCCNEFLWVSTYVAKGIWREELTYAKEMAEQVVKEELIKMLTWYAGIQTNYEVNLGKCGKYLPKYVEAEIWQSFQRTYVDYHFESMWNGLFEMMELFHKLAEYIAERYGYEYKLEEYEAVRAYLHLVRFL